MEKGFLQERIPVVLADCGAATEEEARKKFNIYPTEEGPEYPKGLRCLSAEERSLYLMGEWKIPPNPEDESPSRLIPLRRVKDRKEVLNHIYRIGEPGPGGAYHDYDIYPAGQNPNTSEVAMACIEFQKGPRNDPDSRPGVTEKDLLEIVRDRLVYFQRGPMACRDNYRALFYIEQALMYLDHRTEDRIERGVLGTMEK